MNANKPWVSAAAFAVLIAIIYVVCAVAVVIAPGTTIAFLNNWLHGIDLSLIARNAADPLTVSGLISGFVTAVISAFSAGVLYGWARNLFIRLAFFAARPSSNLDSPEDDVQAHV